MAPNLALTPRDPHFLCLSWRQTNGALSSHPPAGGQGRPTRVTACASVCAHGHKGTGVAGGECGGEAGSLAVLPCPLSRSGGVRASCVLLQVPEYVRWVGQAHGDQAPPGASSGTGFLASPHRHHSHLPGGRGGLARCGQRAANAGEGNLEAKASPSFFFP